MCAKCIAQSQVKGLPEEKKKKEEKRCRGKKDRNDLGQGEEDMENIC